LDYLGWQGYDLPEVMKPWYTENDVTLKATFIAALDDIPAKLAAGGGAGYDLLSYTTAITDRWLAQGGILAPIDVNKIPNLENLLPEFAEPLPGIWSDDDGNRVAVPLDFGSIAILYDDSKTSEPSAWTDLLDPKFADRLAMIDEPNANLQLACVVLGKDPAQLPKEDIDAVSDWLAPFFGQAKAVAPSFGDAANLFASGEVDVCLAGWTAMTLFAAAGGNPNVKANVTPSEGTFSFVDAYAIPTDPDNVDTAYAFINETLDPKINAEANIANAGGVVVDGAVKYLDKATRALYPYDDFTAFFEQSPVTGLPPLESDQYVTGSEWLERWQQLKSEG
jgi:spermidine/putrescine-binding protein